MKKLIKILPEVITFGLCGLLYGYNALRFELPLGYAGLYSLMAEEIKAARFALPLQISYYGPGGLPFAYPPLGLYLEALVTQTFKLPVLAYERFAPAYFGLMALIALYVFLRYLLQSRPKALVGTLLAASFIPLYAAHLYAAGIVRGIAFFFMIVGLTVSWGALQATRFSWPKVLLAGFFLGLTILSHLSYAVFFGMSLLVLALVGFRRINVGVLTGIIGVSLVVASPWWLTLLSRYGLAIFTNAFQTHGTLGLMTRASTNVIGFVNFLSQQFFNFGKNWSSDIFMGLVVLGLGWALARRRWLLPIWFLACFLLIGERDRFLGLIGCILVAELLVDLTQTWGEHSQQTRWNTWLAWAPVVFVLAFGYREALKSVVGERPIISQPVIEATQWVQAHTPTDSIFLFVGSSHDLGEWLPYLMERTPAIGLWGAEWTGKYERQSWLFDQMSECAEQQNFDTCVNRIIQDEEIYQDYLVLPAGYQQLKATLSVLPGWKLAFENDALVVFEDIP